ncbi:MAG: relaxase, partial [Alphaproteobacteria bacterium]|nr:relaxase [Alphaproteobacteria bacterium]
TEDFEKAIEQVEEKLGLSGQPRAIVFHEKEGRKHCHTVWSRINTEEMKAIQLSFSKQKLQSVARELYLEHDWKMPRGLVNSKERDPRNFTLAEWQQAKRIGKDTRAIKADFQDAWAISDSKIAFTHALQERGYKLARGDRRGFVAVDYQGEVYPVSRWTGLKTKQVRERLGDLKNLPNIDETKSLIAKEMLPKMQDFEKEVSTAQKEKAVKAEEQRKKLEIEQQAKQNALAAALKIRQLREEKIRKARIRRGLRGLVDRFTGKRKQTIECNEQEKQKTFVRDKQEKSILTIKQASDREIFLKARKQQQQKYVVEKQELQKDAEHFQQMKTAPKPEDSYKKEFFKKRRASQNKEHIREPTHEL